LVLGGGMNFRAGLCSTPQLIHGTDFFRGGIVFSANITLQKPKQTHLIKNQPSNPK
jgi:hypothetical protein